MPPDGAGDADLRAVTAHLEHAFPHIDPKAVEAAVDAAHRELSTARVPDPHRRLDRLRHTAQTGARPPVNHPGAPHPSPAPMSLPLARRRRPPGRP
ncbi:three-helix bundle dimerization domain-containing protein [Streptomyces virginiae]|uniref:three-helix bundle dimerization domain-containing protein n=1 Tax=Streptomyces virginiae TaxID=1961 RepID=UPI003D31AACC